MVPSARTKPRLWPMAYGYKIGVLANRSFFGERLHPAQLPLHPAAVRRLALKGCLTAHSAAFHCTTNLKRPRKASNHGAFLAVRNLMTDSKSLWQSLADKSCDAQDSRNDYGEGILRIDKSLRIPSSVLKRILQGVVVASRIPTQSITTVAKMFSPISTIHSPASELEVGETAGLTFQEWSHVIQSGLAERDPNSQRLADLTLALAFLGQSSRLGREIQATELDKVWTSIYNALTQLSFEEDLFVASRSAQGFLAVALCSVVENGSIAELFRLHVWLPDGQRGASAFSIHSHQCFAQSWILAGEGKDYTYEVERSTQLNDATHAEYGLVWTDGKELNTAYKTHQTYSKIQNTGKLVFARLKASKVHTCNMTYSIPSAAFHRTEVSPKTLHATLFVFDSAGGFIKDAPILGPIEADSWVQIRDPAGVTPKLLAQTVHALRSWERYVSLGQIYANKGIWKSALNAFHHALRLCDSSTLPNPTYYKRLLLNKLSTVVNSYDEHGNSALDYAICNDDLRGEELVLEALRHKMTCDVEHELHQRLRESRVKKQYRDLFHRKLRPALVKAEEGANLQQVRRIYAEALEEEQAKKRAFDKLKYVPYVEFCKIGRFPRSSDGLTQEFKAKGECIPNYFLFLSYRWVNRDPWATSPDDGEGTQYRRAVRAVETFLKLHPRLDRHRLAIWIDYACIDQDDPMPGIAALPLILVQCDALISLVDSNYHNRAWCSLEVMMIQALRRTYKLHKWYEHAESRQDNRDSPAICDLREGCNDLQISLGKKQVRFEEDRHKILFLERQTRLLC